MQGVRSPRMSAAHAPEDVHPGWWVGHRIHCCRQIPQHLPPTVASIGARLPSGSEWVLARPLAGLSMIGLLVLVT
jgi:hypothetical protein